LARHHWHRRTRGTFADPTLACAVATLLDDRCTAMGSSLDAYCLMPDHVHLLLQITVGNLIHVVRDAKSRTTRL
jgi:REP element-mobilizing transposase RayT